MGSKWRGAQLSCKYPNLTELNHARHNTPIHPTAGCYKEIIGTAIEDT